VVGDNQEGKDYVFGSILINKIKCSNNCVFCKAGSLDYPDDLSEESVAQLEHDTKYFFEKGIKTVDVSGSEPLKYSGIIPYLRRIRSLFDTIIVLDPGLKLANENFAKAFIRTGFDRIVLPIYGSAPAVHDACVQNKRAFKKLVAGIRNLQKFKKDHQQIEITTIILKQNKHNIVDLAMFLRDELGFSGIVVNAPMATEEGVGSFFDEFSVSFASIRDVILGLSKIEGMSFDFKYIPLCIFSEEELRWFNRHGRRMTFFNVFYTYNLPDGKKYEDHAKYVKRYREQVHFPTCDKCYLKKNNICSGILRLHYTKNARYRFHAITKETYDEIKPIIICGSVNKQDG